MNTKKLCCPKCSYITKSQPITGICTECGEYTHLWNIIDKKAYIKHYRFKINIYLFLAFILMLTALFLWPKNIESFELIISGGGIGGLLAIPLLAIAITWEYIVGGYASVPVGFLFLALLFLIPSYLSEQKIVNSKNYKSHNYEFTEING